MSKEVFALTSGDYSSYRVMAIYSTLEIAKQALAKYGIKNPEDFNIETYVLDKNIEAILSDYKPFYILMLKDGTTERSEKASRSTDIINTFYLWDRPNAPYFKNQNPIPPKVLRADVWAKDIKHAIKITNEHRIKLIANNEWDKDE